MSSDSPQWDDYSGEDNKVTRRYIGTAQDVRAEETNKLLNELNNHVSEIGEDNKTLINEVRGLKEAINNLASVIDSSK